MEIIKTDETDDAVMFSRTTDTVRGKAEHYSFIKRDDETWELVGFEDDGGGTHTPPKIPRPIQSTIEERYDVSVEIAPIYPAKCPDCGATASTRVEMEEDDRGYERPANETTEAECYMCAEDKEMEIMPHGLIQGGY